MIGEFEYLMLTAAARLGDEAYGVAIRRAIEGATGRQCSLGALYTTLDRLEDKGYVRTWMGNATAQRGGRPKRMVRVTAKGVTAATAFYDAVVRVSEGAVWATKQVVGSWCRGDPPLLAIRRAPESLVGCRGPRCSVG